MVEVQNQLTLPEAASKAVSFLFLSTPWRSQAIHSPSCCKKILHSPYLSSSSSTVALTCFLKIKIVEINWRSSSDHTPATHTLLAARWIASSSAAVQRYFTNSQPVCVVKKLFNFSLNYFLRCFWPRSATNSREQRTDSGPTADIHGRCTGEAAEKQRKSTEYPIQTRSNNQMVCQGNLPALKN